MRERSCGCWLRPVVGGATDQAAGEGAAVRVVFAARRRFQIDQLPVQAGGQRVGTCMPCGSLIRCSETQSITRQRPVVGVGLIPACMRRTRATGTAPPSRRPEHGLIDLSSHLHATRSPPGPRAAICQTPPRNGQAPVGRRRSHARSGAARGGWRRLFTRFNAISSHVARDRDHAARSTPRPIDETNPGQRHAHRRCHRRAPRSGRVIVGNHSARAGADVPPDRNADGGRMRTLLLAALAAAACAAVAGESLKHAC